MDLLQHCQVVVHELISEVSTCARALHATRRADRDTDVCCTLADPRLTSIHANHIP
jgi:hypothetical protein